MSKAQQLITDHIDIWTSAILAKSGVGRGSRNKYELYGIKKLRELILELAVRGKLVSQDSTDEPASVLLERIAAEKAELVKAKKIKKPKAQAEVTEDEKPFELPESWEWCRLQDVGHDWGQKIPDDEFTYIDVGAVNKELGVIAEPSVLAAKDAPSRARKKVEEGTVIYSTVRPYLLNIAIIDKKFKPEPIASTAFAVVHPLSGISVGFIYRYLRSPSFVKYVESCQTGVAYPAINDKQFFSGLIPVPPAQEQHRIVAKVDELMLLCDQLEQQTEASIDAHGTLVDTLLTTLTDSADADELAENWARIAEHFDTLFTTEKSIDALKQTILQLAVMGKLVPQNPEDEPASVLLEKISDERTKLIKENKIKKEKPLLSVTDEEKPFELPNGWVWQRIGNTCLVVGGIQKQPKRRPILNHYPYLRVANVQRGFISTAELERFELSKTELEKWSLQQGDLLIVEGNGSAEEIGRCAIWSGDVEDCVYQNHLIRVRQLNVQMEQFLAKYLNSPSGIEIMKRMAVTTSGLYNLSVGKIRTIIFPLPPLDEQHRIVKKVEELMTICDQLKDKLQKSQQTQVHLTDALVDSALA